MSCPLKLTSRLKLSAMQDFTAVIIAKVKGETWCESLKVGKIYLIDRCS
jgi:hypothetical protein